MREPKFNGGDQISPITVRVPTYQGPKSEKTDFARPLVPVTVENKCGIVLTLGSTKKKTAPEIICERRKNGWCIVIAPEHSDSKLLVYIIDGDKNGNNTETVVVMD